MRRLAKHGGDRRSDEFQGDGITLVRGTTGKDYLKARLARDYPDILAQYEAGEFASVRQAAVVLDTHPLDGLL